MTVKEFIEKHQIEMRSVLLTTERTLQGQDRPFWGCVFRRGEKKMTVFYTLAGGDEIPKVEDVMVGVLMHESRLLKRFLGEQAFEELLIGLVCEDERR